jgi:ubiquitin thioesterase OTU1
VVFFIIEMAGTPITIRVRTKKGMFRMQNLTANSTLNDLKKAISDLSGIQYSLIKILKGYPPKILENSLNENTTLSSIYIKDGDLLTIEEYTSSNSSIQNNNNSTLSATTPINFNKSKEIPILKDNKNQLKLSLDGILLRKIVPANNSCLFTSVFYVIEDGKLDLDCQKFMRELIAQTVKSDEAFNEGVLGKPKNEYCDW